MPGAGPELGYGGIVAGIGGMMNVGGEVAAGYKDQKTRNELKQRMDAISAATKPIHESMIAGYGDEGSLRGALAQPGMFAALKKAISEGENAGANAWRYGGANRGRSGLMATLARAGEGMGMAEASSRADILGRGRLGLLDLLRRQNELTTMNVAPGENKMKPFGDTLIGAGGKISAIGMGQASGGGGIAT